jgi:osmotically-inducible protein OsmY
MKIQNSGLCLLLCLGLSTAAVTTFTGCAGDKYDRSTGEYVDDKSLTVRVHDALGDNPDYKFDGVNVDVFRGTVQLSGFVNTSDQKSKAADIAKNVQDVKDVVNNITVKETQ